MATKTKEGRKIPSVASSAPGIPPSKYPMKVAAVNSGPGVIWPMATASINCWSVSQPRRRTKSARRKASRTYPPPYRTEPILRRVRNKIGRLKGMVA